MPINFVGGQAGNIRARFEKMATEGAEVGTYIIVLNGQKPVY